MHRVESSLQLEDLDIEEANDLNVVIENSRQTVLETIPEYSGSEDRATKDLGNFDFLSMKQMFLRDITDPTKKIRIARFENELVGQFIYSVKLDNLGRRYGFCYSLYVDSKYRGNGVARGLMEDSLSWFSGWGADYIYAQTHKTNEKARRLFEKFDFVVAGETSRRWEMYELRKSLK